MSSAGHEWTKHERDGWSVCSRCDRIRDVVMRLIASTSDEARGLEAAKDAEDVMGSALAIAAYAADAQVAILAICNDLRHGATPL